MCAPPCSRWLVRNAHAYGSSDCAFSVHPGIVHTELATNFFRQTGMSALPWAQFAAKTALEHLFPLVLRR